MRRIVLTLAGKMRLREIARKKLEIPRMKAVAVELNISPSYARQEVSRLMREMADNVSRETEHLCGEK